MTTRDEFLTAHIPRDRGTVGGMGTPEREIIARARVQLKKRELRGSIIRYLEWAEKEAAQTRERLLEGTDVLAAEDQIRNLRNYGTTLVSMLDRYEALGEL